MCECILKPQTYHALKEIGADDLMNQGLSLSSILSSEKFEQALFTISTFHVRPPYTSFRQQKMEQNWHIILAQDSLFVMLYFGNNQNIFTDFANTLAKNIIKKQGGQRTGKNLSLFLKQFSEIVDARHKKINHLSSFLNLYPIISHPSCNKMKIGSSLSRSPSNDFNNYRLMSFSDPNSSSDKIVNIDGNVLSSQEVSCINGISLNMAEIKSWSLTYPELYTFFSSTLKLRHLTRFEMGFSYCLQNSKTVKWVCRLLNYLKNLEQISFISHDPYPNQILFFIRCHSKLRRVTLLEDKRNTLKQYGYIAAFPDQIEKIKTHVCNDWNYLDFQRFTNLKFVSLIGEINMSLLITIITSLNIQKLHLKQMSVLDDMSLPPPQTSEFPNCLQEFLLAVSTDVPPDVVSWVFFFDLLANLYPNLKHLSIRGLDQDFVIPVSFLNFKKLTWIELNPVHDSNFLTFLSQQTQLETLIFPNLFSLDLTIDLNEQLIWSIIETLISITTFKNLIAHHCAPLIDNSVLKQMIKFLITRKELYFCQLSPKFADFPQDFKRIFHVSPKLIGYSSDLFLKIRNYDFVQIDTVV